MQAGKKLKFTIINCEDIRKNKMIIEFNEHKSSSVKSIAVKSETNIKCTSRFMSGKLYLFASRTAALLKKKNNNRFHLQKIRY